MKLWDARLFRTFFETGSNDLIKRVRNSGPVGRVRDAFTKAVRPGDVVWDAGAGDGTFTELFCQLVGSEGSVFAFEPRAVFHEAIRERLPNCGWLQVEKVALEGFDALLVAGARSTDSGVENSNATWNGTDESGPREACRGDTMCGRLGRIPNVLRVAVQGREEEVLAGMGTKLASRSLRAVMIEINLLEVPRIGMAPRRMEGLLGAMGFTTRWIDESHLFGTRS
jgi:FkbM family methyltransferase